MPLAQFIPSSPSPAVSTSLSPFLPDKYVHQYHFSRFHIHELIYNIHSSLTYFTFYLTGSRFIQLTATDSNLFLFMAE